MATKKTKTKKGSAPAAAQKKSYTYALNLHVDDVLVLNVGGVIGAVKVTNTHPPAARATKGPAGKTFTLTITAMTAGKTTIVATGRTSSILFTFKFTVTVKQQPAAAKPPEQLPRETATLALLPPAPQLTALYHQLTVQGADRIAGSSGAVAAPPGVVVVTAPAPNVPLTITALAPGVATVTVAIEYLKFRETGSPPVPWGTGAPASVQGSTTRTTILASSGPTFPVKLVQVKKNFDFKSVLFQQFVITVVACPDMGGAGPLA